MPTASRHVSESEYREIFNATSEAIVIHDLDGRILDVNDAWCRFNGIAHDAAIGLTASDIPMAPPPYSAQDALEHVRAALQSVPQTFEWLSVRMDGRTFWTEVTLRVTDIAGERRIIAVCREITERKQAELERRKLEESLRQAQKMESIGRLAGGVAHDFNNLLTAINGNITMVLMGEKLSAESAGYLNEATRAVESAARVTRQLLAFSRKQVIQPKIISLNETITRLCNMLRRLLGEDVELSLDLCPDLGLVEIDEGQVEQILVNLAVNARDAMPTGGRLTLETSNVALDESSIALGTPKLDGAFLLEQHSVRAENFVRVSVLDTGVGMTQELKQHLFEPFFTTKGVGKGTGLGLATVYGIVQQGRGQVAIDSEPGIGTAVHVYLPRVNAVNALACAPPTQRDRSSFNGSETIVFVEDADSVRNMATHVLMRRGYRVLAYANGDEALAAFAEMNEHVDLLLTDVVMPGISGIVLAERVKKTHPHLKVLFTSGYSEEFMADRGMRRTEIEFLEKPYSTETLARRVREVLDASGNS